MSGSDKAISWLENATLPLSGNETIPIVQGGTTKKTTISNIPGFGEIYNVKDFGAVGNGVADDTAAIQAAINAASAGDVVLVSQGSYKVTARVNVNKSVTVRVDGTITTTGFAYGSNPIAIFYVTANDVIIEGSGTLSGPGTFSHDDILNIEHIPSLIRVQAANNVTIRNLRFIDGPQTCIAYISADHLTITGNTFTGGSTVAACVASINYYAIHGFTSDYGRIVNNRFTDDASGNTFAEGIFLYFADYTEISSNFFKNVVDHDAYLYHSSGDTAPVNNFCLITNNTSYSTLVNGTQKLGSSFKVHGTHATISDNNIVNPNSGIVLEYGNYSVIADNVISGFNTHGIIISDLVATNADGLNYITVSGNTLQGAASASTYGIYFRGDPNFTTASCVGNKIIGNTITRCGDPSASVPSPIALFHSLAPNIMDSCLIADNVIVGQTGVFGIYAERLRGSTIANNIIKNGTYTGWRGIHFAGNCTQNRITGNTVRDDQATPKLAIGCNFGSISDTDNTTVNNVFHSLYASRDINPWRIDTTYRNLGDRNTNGDTLGYPVALATAEAIENVFANPTILLGTLVPAGVRLVGVQVRVDTALAAGDLWDAEFNGGSSVVFATGRAVAKNTKVNFLCNANAASDITTATTNIVIRKSGGGSFTAQGTFRVLVYYETLRTLGDAP